MQFYGLLKSQLLKRSHLEDNANLREKLYTKETAGGVLNDGA